MRALATIPLPLASPDEPMRVIAFAHPREMEKRLSSMGIALGSEVRLLQREGGNLVVAIGNSRLALGAGLAQKILVASAKG